MALFIQHMMEATRGGMRSQWARISWNFSCEVTTKLAGYIWYMYGWWLFSSHVPKTECAGSKCGWYGMWLVGGSCSTTNQTKPAQQTGVNKQPHRGQLTSKSPTYLHVTQPNTHMYSPDIQYPITATFTSTASHSIV